MPRSRFNGEGPEVLEMYERLREDMVVGDGIIGVREQKLEAPNIETIVPPMRSSSVYYSKEK